MIFYQGIKMSQRSQKGKKRSQQQKESPESKRQRTLDALDVSNVSDIPYVDIPYDLMDLFSPTTFDSAGEIFLPSEPQKTLQSFLKVLDSKKDTTRISHSSILNWKEYHQEKVSKMQLFREYLLENSQQDTSIPVQMKRKENGDIITSLASMYANNQVPSDLSLLDPEDIYISQNREILRSKSPRGSTDAIVLQEAIVEKTKDSRDTGASIYKGLLRKNIGKRNREKEYSCIVKETPLVSWGMYSKYNTGCDAILETLNTLPLNIKGVFRNTKYDRDYIQPILKLYENLHQLSYGGLFMYFDDRLQQIVDTIQYLVGDEGDYIDTSPEYEPQLIMLKGLVDYFFGWIKNDFFTYDTNFSNRNLEAYVDIVGTYLGSLLFEKQLSPHHPTFYGSLPILDGNPLKDSTRQYNWEMPAMLMFMENVPHRENFWEMFGHYENHPEWFKAHVAQIVCAIAIYQGWLGLTHNDLLPHNILFEPTQLKFVTYSFNVQYLNGKSEVAYLRVPTFGYLVKIIDFGLSSVPLYNSDGKTPVQSDTLNVVFEDYNRMLPNPNFYTSALNVSPSPPEEYVALNEGNDMRRLAQTIDLQMGSYVRRLDQTIDLQMAPYTDLYPAYSFASFFLMVMLQICVNNNNENFSLESVFEKCKNENSERVNRGETKMLFSCSDQEYFYFPNSLPSSVCPWSSPMKYLELDLTSFLDGTLSKTGSFFEYAVQKDAVDARDIVYSLPGLVMQLQPSVDDTAESTSTVQTTPVSYEFTSYGATP